MKCQRTAFPYFCTNWNRGIGFFFATWAIWSSGANPRLSKPLPSRFVFAKTISFAPASLRYALWSRTPPTLRLVVFVYLFCTLPFFNRGPKLRNPLDNTEISYYPVSEYLPPLNTAPKAAMKPRHGAPKLARQEILSVPPNAS